MNRITIDKMILLVIVVVSLVAMAMVSSGCSSNDVVRVEDWKLHVLNCKASSKTDAFIDGQSQRAASLDCKWKVSALGS